MTQSKKNLPVDKVRRFLEPGPVVLVSSAYKGERDIMTMGWHMVMGLDPSLVGCFIWNQNHSHELIRKSHECVINIPEAKMINTVIDIGNLHGKKTIDKFQRFNLTAVESDQINAPMIGECFANFECRLVDSSLIKKYSLFIFEVVKAHVAKRPQYPTTVHYRGEGIFMIGGKSVNHARRFKKGKM